MSENPSKAKIIRKRYGPRLKIKVYQCGSKTKTIRRSVPLGGQSFQSTSDQPGPSQTEPCASEQDNTLELNEISADEFTSSMSTGRSAYEKRRETAVSEWTSLRDAFDEAALDDCVMPKVPCTMCRSEQASVRCTDCGAMCLTCESCCLAIHQYGQLHCPERWEGSVYMPFPIEGLQWNRPDGHVCGVANFRRITVLDGEGRQHIRNIRFCECESDAQTLARFHLWPSSPKTPGVAFHFRLMDWLRALKLDAQVSTHAFCETLLHKRVPVSVIHELKNVYKTMCGDPVDEFMKFETRLASLSIIADTVDDPTSCPACAISPTSIFSVVANFGLVRKTSSGRSYGNDVPSGQDFFLDQDSVDKFVSCYGTSRDTGPDEDGTLNNVCSNFQAGEAIRTQRRTAKLDEKAVFGSVCRHGHPYMFCDIKTPGERISYPVTLVENILKRNEGKDLILIYDIACKLKAHLELNKRCDILDQTKFVIPVFHAYGHRIPCQVTYGLNFVSGVGLTDGEGTERLWSYLRRFAAITKEMSPHSRTNLLRDALRHYGGKMRAKLGDLLVVKYKKATGVLNESRTELSRLLQDMNASADDVKCWVEEHITRHSINQPTSMADNEGGDWQGALALYLFEINHIRSCLVTADNNLHNNVLERKCSSLEKKVLSIEKKQKIRQRWRLEDNQCQEAIRAAVDKKRLPVFTDIHRAMLERKFLCSLIRKYAVGQALYKKIDSTIKKTGRSLEKAVSKYNCLGYLPAGRLPTAISKDQSIDPSWEAWRHISVDATNCHLRTEVVNIACRIDRATEEQALIRQEMMSMLLWIEQLRQQHITQLGDLRSDTCRSEAGAKALLVGRIMSLQRWHIYLTSIFEGFITIPSVDLFTLPGLISSHSFQPFEDSDSDSVAHSESDDQDDDLL